MATKKYDLVVKTGTYEKGGQTKNKYQNVGVVLEGSDGPFILLNRHFNPAGVPCDPSRDNIIVSMFGDRGAASGGFATDPNNGDVPF